MNNFSDSDVVKKFSHKDKRKILEWIALVFDKNSELAKTTDLHERKLAAFKKVSLAPDPNIISMESEEIKNLIFHYLGSTQSNRVIQLISNQQLLWGIQQKLMEHTVDDFDEKLKMSASCDALLERIETQITMIYGTDKEITEMVETKIRSLRPEDRVMKQNLG